jgi:hypothetical protein
MPGSANPKPRFGRVQYRRTWVHRTDNKTTTRVGKHEQGSINVFHHRAGQPTELVKKCLAAPTHVAHLQSNRYQTRSLRTSCSHQIQKISLYYFCTCARYAQSRCSFYSAVQLVRLVLDYYHHKPSLIAKALQTP